MIADRAAFLGNCQNSAYADRYAQRITQFAQRVKAPKAVELAAKGLFRMMAYKDEHEVARL